MKTESPTDGAKLPVTLRPDWFTWIFFVGLTLFLWFPVLEEVQNVGLQWAHVGLGLGVTTSVIVLLYTWNIIIGLEGITYRHLFFLSSYMPYDSMTAAQIKLNFPYGRSGKDSNKPVYGLLITPKDSSQMKPLLINIKPFSRNGLALVMQAISFYAPQTRLDKGCERMKQRIMPSFLTRQ